MAVDLPVGKLSLEHLRYVDYPVRNLQGVLRDGNPLVVKAWMYPTILIVDLFISFDLHPSAA
jgi:hypothetical protein